MAKTCQTCGKELSVWSRNIGNGAQDCDQCGAAKHAAEQADMRIGAVQCLVPDTIRTKTESVVPKIIQPNEFRQNFRKGLIRQRNGHLYIAVYPGGSILEDVIDICPQPGSTARLIQVSVGKQFQAIIWRSILTFVGLAVASMIYCYLGMRDSSVPFFVALLISCLVGGAFALLTFLWSIFSLRRDLFQLELQTLEGECYVSIFVRAPQIPELNTMLKEAGIANVIQCQPTVSG